MPAGRLYVLGVLSSVGLCVAADAVDRPISAAKLLLALKGNKAKLVFTSKDAEFLFPAIGSFDDPISGSPGGAYVHLFSPAEGEAVLYAPNSPGKPGWKQKDGTRDVQKFVNPDAPDAFSAVRSLVFREGRDITLRARATGLPLALPQGGAGIRIETGFSRNCALFSAATIRTDVAGKFEAKDALASALADCSDGSLLGGPPTTTTTTLAGGCAMAEDFTCAGDCPAGATCAPAPDFASCRCVDATQPCGDTWPVCGGQCPAGTECREKRSLPFGSCGCFPTGVPACGGTVGICGGACPVGEVCATIFDLPVLGGTPRCRCGAPGPCGAGGDTCPPGFGCGGIPPGSIFCAPIPCSGGSGYPTCNGGCGTGTTCTPLAVSGATLCYCAPSP